MTNILSMLAVGVTTLFLIGSHPRTGRTGGCRLTGSCLARSTTGKRLCQMLLLTCFLITRQPSISYAPFKLTLTCYRRCCLPASEWVLVGVPRGRCRCFIMFLMVSFSYFTSSSSPFFGERKFLRFSFLFFTGTECSVSMDPVSMMMFNSLTVFKRCPSSPLFLLWLLRILFTILDLQGIAPSGCTVSVPLWGIFVVPLS